MTYSAELGGRLVSGCRARFIWVDEEDFRAMWIEAPPHLPAGFVAAPRLFSGTTEHPWPKKHGIGTSDFPMLMRSCFDPTSRVKWHNGVGRAKDLPNKPSRAKIPRLADVKCVQGPVRCSCRGAGLAIGHSGFGLAPGHTDLLISADARAIEEAFRASGGMKQDRHPMLGGGLFFRLIPAGFEQRGFLLSKLVRTTLEYAGVLVEIVPRPSAASRRVASCPPRRLLQAHR